MKLQAPPAVLDLEKSNVNNLQISNSIADAFNDVIALGEFEEAEVTLPLYPAWPAADDSITVADLAKDGASYAGNESVRRLFIANEAGDIDPEVSRLGVDPEVPDLSTIFTTWLPHRRRLGEPLTYLQDDDGTDDRQQRRPIVVQWSDDGGATWMPEEESWTIKLCPDQIGIYFDGNEVPTELSDAGDDARVRITGTVFGDARLRGSATKEDYSANGRTVTQILVLPEKFQHRWRQETGDYASVLEPDNAYADERDDGTAIQEYAEKIRDQNHYAEIDCEFRLPGWHVEYEIGDLITKIAGREISLNAAPSNAPESRYMQVVERRFELSENDGPSTVLIMDRGTDAT